MEWLEGCGTLCVRGGCIRGVKNKCDLSNAETQRRRGFFRGSNIHRVIAFFLLRSLLSKNKSLRFCVSAFNKREDERSGLLYFESRRDGGVYALPAPMQDK